MTNRQLTESELAEANRYLNEIRHRLAQMSGNDSQLLFALRRKIAKELTYDERSKPSHRKRLKLRMHNLQKGLCAQCEKAILPTYAVLDRCKAIDGYVEANVRLICLECDREIQKRRGYK